MPEDTEETMDLSTAITLLENPIRRKLLQKLAISPNYPLQLARELGLSQQVVMNHLKVLEEGGLVRSYPAPSDSGGPPRKLYVLQGRYTVIMDVGPNLYDERLITFKGSLQKLPLPEDVKEALLQVSREIEMAGKAAPGERERALTELMQKVEREIGDIEVYRSALLTLKDRIGELLKESLQEKLNLRDWQERELLYYMLWEGIKDLQELAKVLDMREETIRTLVEELVDGILPRDMIEGL